MFVYEQVVSELPEGDVVEVLGELCQVWTLLLILLFRPQQHLGKLDSETGR